MEKPKLRILFVPSWYPEPDNPFKGIFIKNHAATLDGMADVRVIYAFHSPNEIPDYREEQAEENRTISVPVVHSGKQGSFLYLIKYLKALKLAFNRITNDGWTPDLIHAHVTWPAAFFAWRLSKKIRKPFGITEHLDLFLREKLGMQKATWFGKLVRKFLSRQADFVTVCSEAMKTAYSDAGISNNVYVVPNNLPQVSPPPPHFVDTDRPRFLHISNLNDHQKNVSGLLRAIASLNDAGDPGFELHFLGSGKELEQKKQLADELGLLNTICFFHGFVSDEEKTRWMHESHGFVMFSNYEGFSVVTAEALAGGLPVISTTCGGPEDFVTNKNGMLIPVGNQNALCKALSQLKIDYSRYDRLTLYNEMMKKFGNGAVGQMFMHRYEQACYK